MERSVLFLLPLLAACSGAEARYVREEPLPTVPPENAITVLVSNEVQVDGLSDDNKARFERHLQSAAQELRTALLQSGYEVVTDPSKPFDVSASLSGEFDPNFYTELHGKTTVTFEHEGRLVERVEV